MFIYEFFPRSLNEHEMKRYRATSLSKAMLRVEDAILSFLGSQAALAWYSEIGYYNFKKENQTTCGKSGNSRFSI